MRIFRNTEPGAEIDATSGMYPSRLQVREGSGRAGSSTSTTYGYVLSGCVEVACRGFELRLDAGGYFAVPDALELRGTGRAVLIERLGFRGMYAAGRIESVGRLAYVDGCSDTILVCPPRSGDPVLNYLHFPPGVVQTLHTHPSNRLGAVARGSGLAYGQAPGGAPWEEPLTAGSVFLLDAHELHAFKTTSGEAMDVVAYHPDSDWGPTDFAHPMLNRTYLAQKRT